MSLYWTGLLIAVGVLPSAVLQYQWDVGSIALTVLVAWLIFMPMAALANCIRYNKIHVGYGTLAMMERMEAQMEMFRLMLESRYAR